MDKYESVGIKRTPLIDGRVVYEGDANNPAMQELAAMAKAYNWVVIYYNIANDGSLKNRIRVTEGR